MPALRFHITAAEPAGPARTGRVETAHGSFETPAFMPVGTRASVKGIPPHLVRQSGSQVLLNNTYHLMLRPGPETISRLGGVHRFMNWDGPILTDSGGYQAFSLSDTLRLDADAVTFRSIIDGREVRLTPRRAVQVQNLLGADIIMALDDCPPALAPGGDRLAYERRLDDANERTVRWLHECAAAHARPDDQSLFGIVQGGTDLARREWSASRIGAFDLPGYAIGGVAVGESSADIQRVVAHTAPLLPSDRPRYLMGVGYERDLLAAVRAGVDMFDCVLPTRNGRNANAFTRAGQIRLRNARFAEDPGVIEHGCDCHACSPAAHGWGSPSAQGFSRAYLRHLFMAGEMLGPILVTLHNLRHFQRFMADLRACIPGGEWGGLAARWPVLAPSQPTESRLPEPQQ